MTSINATNLNETCRTCAKIADPITMYAVFRDYNPIEDFESKFHLVEFLFKYLRIKFADGMPQNICTDCFEIIQTIKQFINKSLISQQYLKEILSMEKPKEDKPVLEFMDVEESEEWTNPENTKTGDLLKTFVGSKVEASTADRLEIGAAEAGNTTDLFDSDNFENNLSDFDHDPDNLAMECRKMKQKITNKKTKKCNEPKNAELPRKSIRISALEPTKSKNKNSEVIKHKFQCLTCKQTFKREHDLKTHNSTQHIEESIAYTIDNVETRKSSKQMTCPICDLNERSELELVKHIRTIHPSLTCPFCDRTFFNVINRNKHIETHNKCDNYKCETCQKPFKNKINLYRHMRKVHGKTQYECSDCGSQFNDEKKYNNHLKTHDKNVKYDCTTCGKSFSLLHRLKAHEFLHTGLKPHLCNICGKGFALSANLKGHLVQVHSDERKFKCNICGKGFAFRNTCMRHMQSHEGTVPQRFICEHCGKGFADKGALKIHVRRHTGEKPFKCDFCDNTFVQKGSLMSHNFFMHGGPGRVKGAIVATKLDVIPSPPVFIEKISSDTSNALSKAIKTLPFICTVCSKAFRLPVSLKKHFKQYHTEARPHPCLHCTLSFKTKTILNTHVKAIHLKLKPHTCQVCSKGFLQLSTLNVHMRSHTGEKPYACTICNKSFALIQRLKVHMRSHSDEKTFKCELCSEEFKYYKVLSYHMRTKHRNWTSCATSELPPNLSETLVGHL